MCYRANIPGEIDFVANYIVSYEAKRLSLKAYGYGISTGDPKSYGNGCIGADLDDIMPYMRN